MEFKDFRVGETVRFWKTYRTYRQWHSFLKAGRIEAFDLNQQYALVRSGKTLYRIWVAVLNPNED